MEQAGNRKKTAFVMVFWAAIVVLTVFLGWKLIDRSSSGRSMAGREVAEIDKTVEKRIAGFRKSLSENPDDLQALVGLGDVYFESKMYEQAIELFLRAEKLSGPSVHIENDLGLLYLNTNRPLQAIPRFERALEIDPTHLVSLYYVGVSFQQLGEKDKAMRVYKRILSADPSPELARAVKQEIATLRPDAQFR